MQAKYAAHVQEFYGRLQRGIPVYVSLFARRYRCSAKAVVERVVV